ncbi:MAG: TetR/AcrR family transcriptional regulator [Actinomycetota bacterium]
MTSTTPERIADAALRRFNRQGYATTKLTEIAADVGISQGNLTYHFPAKLDLALHLSERVRVRTEARGAERTRGEIAGDYVEHLLFGLEMTWNYRFLLRDRGVFDDADAIVPPSPILVADMAELRALVTRIADAGLFRSDIELDLDVLTRSLWILSRYWMDHLREMEERDEIEWSDVERGVEHHFAALLPALTAAGRRRFAAALERSAAVRRGDGST